jgi:GNAT superfamily N-acetyltransferase
MTCASGTDSSEFSSVRLTIAMRIRPMIAGDVPRGMALTNQAGWNQSPADWQRLLHLQPDGCFVAESDGAVVGTACLTVFGSVGWISMVLVDAAYRNHGIGTRLLEHSLSYLDRRQVKTARLDATALGLPIYTKLGFVAEYEVARWEGAAGLPRLPGADGDDGPLEWEGANLRTIVVAGREHIDAIADLDFRATGTPRGALLERLRCEGPPTLRIALVGGQLAGYSSARLGSHARQIGPVVALDAASAVALLGVTLPDHFGHQVYQDIPVTNRLAMSWAAAQGLRIQRRFIRMSRGEPIIDHPEWICASSGPEKG